MGGKKPKILSAGVIIVRYFDAGWRYLLLRVYDYWDFPKGARGWPALRDRPVEGTH